MSATVAIVAGGGGPLGHATAVALAADGLTVVAVDRTEHAMGDLPEDIQREVADATDPAEAARLIGRIAGEAGPPDVLVNTIGAFRPEDMPATTPEMLRLMLDVNLGPALWLTQAVAPHMRQQGSGVRCHRARGRPPGDRAGQRHGGLQREQGRSCPPDTHSGYRTAPAGDPGERGRAAAARHPQKPGHVPGGGDGARGRAEAIAGVIAFLVSDAAAAVSGAILPAYGA